MAVLHFIDVPIFTKFIMSTSSKKLLQLQAEGDYSSLKYGLNNSGEVPVFNVAGMI